MSKKTNPRKDFTQIAHGVFQRVIGENPPSEPSPEKKAAVESGRRGGLKGGAKRAAKLTPERRSAIAKKAAKTRWG